MRLIDADALYEQAANTAEHYCGFFNYMEKVISARNIDQAPTIDAVPVVHGKWIIHIDAPVGTVCSECGFSWSREINAVTLNPVLSKIKTNYCPNCGAKMRPTSMSGANGGANK